MSAGEALQRADIKPLTLEAKEAISLINGTQAMLAVGLLALAAGGDPGRHRRRDRSADARRSAGNRRRVRRTHSQGASASRAVAGRRQNLRRMLEGSQIRESHRDCGKVQDAYSLRCIPQVHGAVRDTLAHAAQVFEIEMNSAVDNPLVFLRRGAMGARERPSSQRRHLRRQLSRRAPGLRSRLPGDRAERAGRNLRAAHWSGW